MQKGTEKKNGYIYNDLAARRGGWTSKQEKTTHNKRGKKPEVGTKSQSQKRKELNATKKGRNFCVA